MDNHELKEFKDSLRIILEVLSEEANNTNLHSHEFFKGQSSGLRIAVNCVRKYMKLDDLDEKDVSDLE